MEHARRVHGESVALARLRADGSLPYLELPRLIDGVDPGSLYTLAAALREQTAGVSA